MFITYDRFFVTMIYIYVLFYWKGQIAVLERFFLLERKGEIKSFSICLSIVFGIFWDSAYIQTQNSDSEFEKDKDFLTPSIRDVVFTIGSLET